MTALELINIIRPNHDRNSCNDNSDVGNGLCFDNDGKLLPNIHIACRRCALLRIAERPDIDIETLNQMDNLY